MVDIFSPAKRSWIMSRIRSKNTKIDLLMKRMLEENWLAYIMYPNIFGSPVFVLKDKQIAIFCDGEFWHGYRYYEKKKPGKKYWREKIERNMRRDKLVARKLRSMGYRVLRFWGHDIEKKPEVCLGRIKRSVAKRA